MYPATSTGVTELFGHCGKGNQDARDALIPLVYGELRRMARRYLQREHGDHTLQSSALDGEAYLRLVRQDAPQWQNRTHFFGVAAQLIRNILVDHARGRLAAKRGAGASRLTLDPQILFAQKREVELVAVDDSFKQPAALDPLHARPEELRFFGELSIEEASIVLGVSRATVKREWETARAWLQRGMNN